MKNNSNILIVGAGLCGSLLALRLAQRGHQIILVEKRADLRKNELPAGRSINLAFSNRGAKAMKMAGILNKVDKLLIPMYGRMIHEEGGDNTFFPYSGLKEEFINSVPRTGLNALLLDEAEKMENVHLYFNHECIAVNLDKAEATFKRNDTQEEIQFSGDFIIGTDGAGSTVRKSMFLKPDLIFNYSQQYLSHGYKELYIPPAKNGNHQLEKNALHIWPRGENMIIALPNMDGSFTVTLFMSHKEATYNFKELDSPEKVRDYFSKKYPDALALMPNLEELFTQNPTSVLGTIRCSPWHYKGKGLIMGDAAHAMVPFYGQGMNASFEDVYVFDQILDQELDSWEETFQAFEKIRKPDATAIQELSLDNFQEMKADTASPLFQHKRVLENELEEKFPAEYSGKYRLVTFQEQIGYDEAMKKGRAQDKAMLKLLSYGKIHKDLSAKEKLMMVNEATQAILKEATESSLV